MHFLARAERCGCSESVALEINTHTLFSPLSRFPRSRILDYFREIRAYRLIGIRLRNEIHVFFSLSCFFPHFHLILTLRLIPLGENSGFSYIS